MTESCFNGNRGVWCSFCCFCEPWEPCLAGRVLVVVFHTGLWQPWRASIFSAARLCRPESYTTAEDWKGLAHFFQQSLYFFRNLTLTYSFTGVYFFLFWWDKIFKPCAIANANLILHYTTFLHMELVCLHCIVYNFTVFSPFNHIFLILYLMTQLELT